jgi:hypothetical protein
LVLKICGIFLKSLVNGKRIFIIFLISIFSEFLFQLDNFIFEFFAVDFSLTDEMQEFVVVVAEFDVVFSDLFEELLKFEKFFGLF